MLAVVVEPCGPRWELPRPNNKWRATWATPARLPMHESVKGRGEIGALGSHALHALQGALSRSSNNRGQQEQGEQGGACAHAFARSERPPNCRKCTGGAGGSSAPGGRPP